MKHYSFQIFYQNITSIFKARHTINTEKIKSLDWHLEHKGFFKYLYTACPLNLQRGPRKTL